MISLIGMWWSAIAWAEPNQVTIYSDDDGFKVQVDGEDTMLRGMNWGYMPVGENYRYDFWSLPEDTIEKALRTEMGLLKNMGVNTIRQYPVIPPEWVEWIHDNYGIYTMINPLVGRYGTNINGTYVPATPYGDPDVRKQLIDETMAVVETYKDTRGVIMFMLGNEANYGLEWSSFEIANLPKGDRQKAKARHLYSLYGEIVDRIKAVDRNHLVTICNGDLQYLDLIAELIPNQDLFGTNVYRGRSSGDLFQRVKDELGIPVFYAEFGSDAYNAKDGREDGLMQADYLHDLWTEVYAESYGKGGTGAAVGGYTFQWSDGWWKYNQEINLDVHDTTASWSNKAYLADWEEGQNNMNEEWFGIVAKTPPNKEGLYEVQPREAYFMLKDMYDWIAAQGGAYSPFLDATIVREGLAAFDPLLYVTQAQVAKIAGGGANQKFRISDLRMDIGTITSGGSSRVGRGFGNITNDHLQSVYIGAEATPDDSLRFDASFNVLGNVPGNYIDVIRYETRGRGVDSTVTTEGGSRVDLANLNRLQIYRMSFDWKTKNFDLKGYYRTGSYHWAFEGDFFGIKPETNYGPNLDLYNGVAPIAVEFNGKGWLDGLTIIGGPQVFWGANPSVIAKYSRAKGRYRFDIIHQEDVAPLPTAAVAQSQAVPEQLTRKTAVHVARGSFEDKWMVSLGGIWAGTPKIGQQFTYVEEVSNCDPDATSDQPDSYQGSCNNVLRDQIRMVDTFGAKARVIGTLGSVQGFVQGAYKGLVADGGWENWRFGTRLGESGRGNQMNAWGGATVNAGNVMVSTSGIYQKPLIGPNPSIGASFDADTRVVFPGVAARNFIEDPFAVLENREMLAGEIIFKWDPTPITYFYQWDNELREDANFAFDLAFVYKHMPTVRDSNFGFLADGTLFSFGGSPPAADLWEASTRIVSNVGDVQLHLNGYVGTAQSRGTDPRLITRKGGGFKAYWRSMVFNGWVKVDDWGPYDFHRDFNLTFPLQTYLDISGGLSRPSFVNASTRIGGFVKFRFLDEFSPVPSAIGGSQDDIPALQPDDAWGNEFAVGTYVRLSL
ncbi:MAG: hypothetical protein KTR31_20950 [Myxococcales bacterium]|nr:hypothetical protein [Myxococcales bacterium]